MPTNHWFRLVQNQKTILFGNSSSVSSIYLRVFLEHFFTTERDAVVPKEMAEIPFCRIKNRLAKCGGSVFRSLIMMNDDSIDRTTERDLELIFNVFNWRQKETPVSFCLFLCLRELLDASC
jgi:hypothetical protein